MHARTIFCIGIFSYLYNWISCIHSRRDQKDLLVKLSDLTAADVRSGSETSQHACRNPRSICTSEPDVIENSAFFMHCALISICARLDRMRSRSGPAAAEAVRWVCRGSSRATPSSLPHRPQPALPAPGTMVRHNSPPQA